MIEEYWQIWEAGRARNDPRFLGEDPLVGSTRHVVIAETDKEAVALARRAFVAYAEHFYCTDPRLGPHASPAALPMPGGTNFDTMREAGQVLAGSVATVRDALRRYLEVVGPKHNYLCGAFQWGDLTTDEARRSLDLFAAEVRPALS